MLQIHSYAQLTHWAVVTLTTVEGPGYSRSFAHVVFQILFISEKKNLNKTTQSMSRLSPEYQRLISSSLYSNMLQLLRLPQRQTRRAQQSQVQLPQWHPRPRPFSYTSTKQARCDRPRLLSFRPRGSNSDTMVLVVLSHGLLTYTAHLQAMVFVLPPWSKPQGCPQA
jgi:hypothetical protein